jgi:hypothetical protein
LGDAFQADKGEESMAAFAKHLPGMSHLRHLSLEANDFGEAGKRTLVKVLEEGVNPLLLELTLGGRQTSLQHCIDFLLSSKNIGGKRALSSCSRMEWINLLACFTNNEDLSALCFTLRSSLSEPPVKNHNVPLSLFEARGCRKREENAFLTWITWWQAMSVINVSCYI